MKIEHFSKPGTDGSLADNLLKFYNDGHLSYGSSYEDCREIAQKYLDQFKGKELEQINSLNVQSCVDEVLQLPMVQKLTADDMFDLKIGFKNFCIAVKDLSNGYTPKFRDFKGSKRNGLVSIDAFEFTGHNKELASTHVDYSYLDK